MTNNPVDPKEQDPKESEESTDSQEGPSLLEADEVPERRIFRDEDEEGASSSESSEEEENEEPEEEDESPKGLPGYSTPQELLTAELPARARYVDSKLRSNLVGSIIIHLRDSSEKFLFDWSTESLRTGPLSDFTKEGAGEASYDCTVHLSGSNLMKIAGGNLNPQIGMLSDKIRVEGKASLAIYFFNLVAPRQHQGR